VLRGIFATAVRHDAVLDANVPSVKISKRKAGAKKTTRRPAFDKPEYDRLVKYMRQWRTQGRNPAENDRRALLRDYVLFLVSSGLRPGTETDGLLWQHISEFTGTDRRQYLKITVEDGKTGDRSVVPMERARNYLDRIKQRQIAATGQAPSPSQHVFATPDGKHVRHDSLRQLFCRLLADMGMETDSKGNRYTLYSCRHTYATFRLMNGEVEIKTLAKNMGTSVPMIDQHYGQVKTQQAAKMLTRLARS
jgi:integrase